MIKFEWNSAKAKSNQTKHKVSFDEAQSVFFDEYAQQFYDPEHSEDEERFIMLGKSIRSRVLVVVHCERDGGAIIRIISARKATARECEFYQGPSL